MQPMVRTLIFVAVAAGSAVAAYVTHRATEPAPVAGFETVGEAFYPEFDDSSQATALRVAAWDDGKPKTFTVELRDGQWRIPSHHDYPAEAKQRLAKTAASVVGLERAALASRWKSEHERLGVVDPLDETIASSEGRGHRLTLYGNAGKEDGEQREELADFIVGHEVPDRPGDYYVRRPDENETYFVTLDLDLSTRFADWIEQDLLKLDAGDVLKLTSQRPVIDQRGVLIGEDRVVLHREKSFDPWTMDGLEAETEEVNADRVRELVDGIAGLQIVGVRPKPRGLTAELRLDPKVSSDPRVEAILVRELESKGYFLRELQTGQRRLFSEGGELIAATGDGLLYHLHFGDAFRGTEDEIEFGGTQDDAATTDTKDGESTADGSETTADNDNGLQLSRYLFVRVEFDPTLLGEKPVAPTEPEKPEGFDSGEEGQPEADAKDEAEKSDSAAVEPVRAPDPRKAEYETALAKYRQEKSEYDRQIKEYEAKREKSQQRADVLNARFGEWYYVIDAGRFEDLKISRSDLVQPKTHPESVAPPTADDATTPESVEPVAAPMPPK